MAIDKTTNKLSTTNAQGEKAENRYRTTFSAPEPGVELGAVLTGQRTDFTGADRRHLVEDIYQNVVDGFRGSMTVPGGAIIKVTQWTNSNSLSIQPDYAWRRTSSGDHVAVKGMRLTTPLGEPGRRLLSATEVKAKEMQAFKTVIVRAQKAKAELDARNKFTEMRATRVNLDNWVAGDDVEEDEAIEIELTAARLGFRGNGFGPAVNLDHWEPGASTDDDSSIAQELDEYRSKFAD